MKPEQPSVSPDEPRVTTELTPYQPVVTPQQAASAPNETTDTSYRPRVTPEEPEVNTEQTQGGSDRPQRRPDESAVIPDQPPARPQHEEHPSQAVIPDTAWEWSSSSDPEPGDSGDVIEDKPVSRPSDSYPEWPSHTPESEPKRPEKSGSEEVETKENKPKVTEEPDVGGGGSGNSSARVEFPGEDLIPIPSCNDQLYYGYVNSTGECVKLWTDSEAGCAEGEWFVVDPSTGDTTCRSRFCRVGETLFDDVCKKTSGSHNSPCNAGMGVFLDHFGVGFCDCLAYNVYWPEEERCYPVYQQGPCPAGQQLAVEENSRRVICQPARCPDGEVYWGDDKRNISAACYSATKMRKDDPAKLNISATDPCPIGGKLSIDIHTLEVDCKQLQLQAVFDPPQVRCPAGSFLDFTGQCRDELVQKFRSSFIVQQSENRSPCPEGFTINPAGGCVDTSLGGGGLGR